MQEQQQHRCGLCDLLIGTCIGRICMSTVEPLLSRPQLFGFLDYLDFSSGPNLVMNIY